MEFAGFKTEKELLLFLCAGLSIVETQVEKGQKESADEVLGSLIKTAKSYLAENKPPESNLAPIEDVEIVEVPIVGEVR